MPAGDIGVGKSRAFQRLPALRYLLGVKLHVEIALAQLFGNLCELEDRPGDVFGQAVGDDKNDHDHQR